MLHAAAATKRKRRVKSESNYEAESAGERRRKRARLLGPVAATTALRRARLLECTNNFDAEWKVASTSRRRRRPAERLDNRERSSDSSVDSSDSSDSSGSSDSSDSMDSEPTDFDGNVEEEEEEEEKKERKEPMQIEENEEPETDVAAESALRSRAGPILSSYAVGVRDRTGARGQSTLDKRMHNLEKTAPPAQTNARVNSTDVTELIEKKVMSDRVQSEASRIGRQIRSTAEMRRAFRREDGESGRVRIVNPLAHTERTRVAEEAFKHDMLKLAFKRLNGGGGESTGGAVEDFANEGSASARAPASTSDSVLAPESFLAAEAEAGPANDSDEVEINELRRFSLVESDFLDSMIGQFRRLNETLHAKRSLGDGEKGSAPAVALLPRMHLLDFLREPIPEAGERECSLGEHCESRELLRFLSGERNVSTAATGDEPYALRELLLPEDQAIVWENLDRGVPIKLTLERMPRRPCLICERLITNMLATGFTSSIEKSHVKIVQNHGNLFGEEGEYNVDRQLVLGQTFHGLVVPFVAYDRDDYVPCTYEVRYEAIAAGGGQSEGVYRTKRVRGWAEIESMVHALSENTGGPTSARTFGTQCQLEPLLRAGGTRTRSVYADPPTTRELLTRWYDLNCLFAALRPSVNLRTAAYAEHLPALFATDPDESVRCVESIVRALRAATDDADCSGGRRCDGTMLGVLDDFAPAGLLGRWSVDERAFSVSRCRRYAALCLRVNLGQRMLERERAVAGGDAAVDRAAYRAIKLELFLESHAPLCAWFCALPERDPSNPSNPSDPSERFADVNLPPGAPIPRIRERRCASDWSDRRAEGDEPDAHLRTVDLAWHRTPAETLLGAGRSGPGAALALRDPENLYLRPLLKVCDAFAILERRTDRERPEEGESDKHRAIAAHLCRWLRAFCEDRRPETEALRRLHAETNPDVTLRNRCGLWSLTYCAWRCEDALTSETRPAFRRALHGRRMALLPLYRWTWTRTDDRLSVEDDAMPVASLCPRGYAERTADAMSARGLPQMSAAVHRIRFWYVSHVEKLAAARGPEKALPFRSHGRSIARMLCNTCDDSDAYYRFVQRLLFCSVAGGYFVDSYRPRLDTIRRVTAVIGRDKASVVKFLRAQPLLVPYVLQEHLVYVMRSLPHLRETQSLPHLREVHDTVEWPVFEKKVRDTMDAYRRHLDSADSADAAERGAPVAREEPNEEESEEQEEEEEPEEKGKAKKKKKYVEPMNPADAAWSFERDLVRRDNNKPRFPYQKKSFVQRVLDRVRIVQGDLQLAELVYEETLKDLQWARTLKRKREEQIAAGAMTRAAVTWRKIEDAVLKAAPYRISERKGAEKIAKTEKSAAKAPAEPEIASDLDRCATDVETHLNRIRGWIAVPSDVKRAIWEMTFGDRRTDDEERRVLSDLLTDRGVDVFAELIDLYVRRVSPSELKEVLGDLPIEIVSRLYFVLRVLTFARSVQLVPLDMASVRRVETAMRDRYRLTEGEELPASAYHVHLTPCCGRVATFVTPHSYGSQKIVYDSHRRRYTCGKKASAKGGGNRVSAKFDPGAPSLNKDGRVFSLRDEESNSKRKMARQVKRQRDQMQCAGTPVITLNLQGFRLVYGDKPKVQISMRHCLRCANLYRCEVRTRPGSYGGDAICDGCSETMPERALVAPCFHCRRPLVVGQGNSHPLVDLDDCERPLKRRRYCVKHAPAVRGVRGMRNRRNGAERTLLHADQHRAHLLSQQNRMAREMNRVTTPAEKAQRNATIRRNAARWDPRNRRN